VAANVRQTAVVVCPGRGTYNAAELGYLKRHHPGQAPLLEMFDAERARLGQPGVAALDRAAAYDPAVHGRGDNASALIFASSLADYLAIDRDTFDIVAVTGNSMGWYTALACGGALQADAGFRVCNTMGALMHEASIGGQMIYALVDDDWRPIPGRREALIEAIAAVHGHDDAEVYVSIELGGMLVVAGNFAGIAALAERAPRGPGRFPVALAGHAAFHTPLQAPVSARAKAMVSPEGFGGPAIALIDGAGRIWRPYATDPAALWDYTLGQQVVETYDFTAAMRVAVREFAPDRIIVLGPGETLGSAVAQSLIAARWRGLDSKAAFAAAQAADPLVLAMGRADQRAEVLAS
jgi:acyl transferase domain-containing protein